MLCRVFIHAGPDLVDKEFRSVLVRSNERGTSPAQTAMRYIYRSTDGVYLPVNRRGGYIYRSTYRGTSPALM